MCAGCLTSAEAVVITSGSAIVVAKAGLVRLHDRLLGRPRGLRAAEAYDANAAFLVELGHNPELLLGERPAVIAVPEHATTPVGGVALASAH